MEEKVNTTIKCNLLQEEDNDKQKDHWMNYQRTRVLVLNCHGFLVLCCLVAWRLFLDLAFLIYEMKRPK